MRSFIGKTVHKGLFHIEKSRLEHFKKAIVLQNGVHDPNHIPAAYLLALSKMEAVFEVLNVENRQILQSRDKITHFTPMNPNKCIRVTTKIKDLFEQQGNTNPLGFIVLELKGTQGKDTIFEGERIIVLRGGFMRSNLNGQSILE